MNRVKMDSNGNYPMNYLKKRFEDRPAFSEVTSLMIKNFANYFDGFWDNKFYNTIEFKHYGSNKDGAKFLSVEITQSGNFRIECERYYYVRNDIIKHKSEFGELANLRKSTKTMLAKNYESLKSKLQIAKKFLG